MNEVRPMSTIDSSSSLREKTTAVTVSDTGRDSTNKVIHESSQIALNGKCRPYIGLQTEGSPE